jgi:hypothetical protein
MTPFGRRFTWIAARHRLALKAGLCLTTAAALSGCGSGATKTGDTLDAAELAVARAEQSRVGDYDSIDLRQAQDKLAAAHAAARTAELNKDGKAAEQARWLAQEARVDAELASARAQQSKIQAVLLQKQRSIDEATPTAVPALPGVQSPAEPSPGVQP